jgi:hypothetical protein
MDLSKFVVDEPPIPRGKTAWPARFETILDQKLTGRWINASRAFGVKGNNAVQAKAAGERCGLHVDARSVHGELFVLIK